MSDFRDEYNKVKPKVILIFKRIYVLAFNIYAWYWLYRQIFIIELPRIPSQCLKLKTKKRTPNKVYMP